MTRRSYRQDDSCLWSPLEVVASLILHAGDNMRICLEFPLLNLAVISSLLILSLITVLILYT